jgi:Tfp pilus assembly protein FimT
MNTARGYSLLEVMLVCALIGSGSTLGLSILNEIAVHLAGESFSSAVMAARFQAVAKNLATLVRVHPSRRKFGLAVKDSEPQFWQDLPTGVEFSKIPRMPPRFYSRGYASPAGTFILENSRGRIRVIVSLSGRVRWERVR